MLKQLTLLPLLVALATAEDDEDREVIEGAWLGCAPHRSCWTDTEPIYAEGEEWP